jgi:hypothetical protein
MCTFPRLPMFSGRASLHKWLSCQAVAEVRSGVQYNMHIGLSSKLAGRQ